MSLTKDNIFQVKLRDRLLALDLLTADTVVNEISSEIISTFHRREMLDFKYLEAEIDPPLWLMVVCLVLIFVAYIAFWIFVFRERNPLAFTNYGAPRWSSQSSNRRFRY